MLVLSAFSLCSAAGVELPSTLWQHIIALAEVSSMAWAIFVERFFEGCSLP